MKITPLGSVALLVLVPAQLQAQSGESAPISSDRPGFLFAPTLVPPGRLQFEAGVPSLTLAREAGDELRVWSLPVAARYGWSERSLELRAALPTWTDVRDESGPGVTHEEGFADAELGAKLALAPLAGGPLALLGSLRLPTGEDGFTTEELGASAYLLHGRELGANWLQAMLGVSHVPVDGAEDATTGALAALVSRPLAQRWSGYVELTALPGVRHAAGQAYAGCALLWMPHDRLQLDLSADFGLDDDAADVVAALGISWCF